MSEELAVPHGGHSWQRQESAAPFEAWRHCEKASVTGREGMWGER